MEFVTCDGTATEGYKIMSGINGEGGTTKEHARTIEPHTLDTRICSLSSRKSGSLLSFEVPLYSLVGVLAASIFFRFESRSLAGSRWQR